MATPVSSMSAGGQVVSYAATQTSGNGMSDAMNSDFMMMLLAQLRHQNPLEPLQDKDMMAQFTQISSLNELQSISDTLRTLSSANQLTQASALIGKTVEYMGSDGRTQTGLVSGVSASGGQVMLWLGERQLPLNSIISIRQEPQA